MNVKVCIKKLDPRAVMPIYATRYSAGADLYAVLDCESDTLMPHETKMYHTYLSVQIPDGYMGLVFARSGISVKKGLAPANKVGVIDSDYRGEIMVALHNHTDNEMTVQNLERIAQFVIVPYYQAEFELTDNLNDTERSSGGFGSTGVY